MKMFVSRYALSGGIKEVEGKVSSVEGYFCTQPTYTLHRIGRDCHPTREEAIAAAEAMRVKRLASLRKQVAKLEKLTFGEGK